MADLVRLEVNGRAYGGWTAVRVTRGIESIAGSFALEVSERWRGQANPWPIRDEDACVVRAGDDVLITGFVDSRTRRLEGDAHTFSVAGRDRTGALVDNSAVLDHYEFAGIGVLELCALVTKPFGIDVSLQDGLSDKALSTTGRKTTTAKPLHGGTPSSVGSAGKSSSLKLGQPNAKFAVNPGDSAFEVIDRACRLVGVLPVSDGTGGLVLTRTGGARATSSLVEGQNVLSAEHATDATKRYRTYVVSGQSAGSDDVWGEAAAMVRGQAVDLTVQRAERVLLIRPEGSVTLAFARSRAAWESTVRFARATTLTVTVPGWRQRDGALWPINALVPVYLPTLGITGEDLLITEAQYAVGAQGSTTQLKLVAANAFLPEPTIPPSNGGVGAAPAFLGS